MKAKQTIAVIALTISALLVGACSKNASNANGSANGNSTTSTNGSTNGNANGTAKTASTGEDTTPTAVFKSLYAALQKKDVENIKSRLSTGTLKKLQELSEKQEQSLDDTLRENLTDPDYNSPTVPEIRNEKINGETATIEVKTPTTGKWTELPFVKEDGRWKLAYDKVAQDAMVTTESGAPPPPGANRKQPSTNDNKH